MHEKGEKTSCLQFCHDTGTRCSALSVPWLCRDPRVGWGAPAAFITLCTGEKYRGNNNTKAPNSPGSKYLPIWPNKTSRSHLSSAINRTTAPACSKPSAPFNPVRPCHCPDPEGTRNGVWRGEICCCSYKHVLPVQKSSNPCVCQQFPALSFGNVKGNKSSWCSQN